MVILKLLILKGTEKFCCVHLSSQNTSFIYFKNFYPGNNEILANHLKNYWQTRFDIEQTISVSPVFVILY